MINEFQNLILRVATCAAIVAVAVPANAQMDRYDALANSAMSENRPTTETAKLLKDELLFERRHPDLSMGAAADQHTRHEVRLRENIRGRLQRPADLEEAARRQDARHHAELRRDLCDELPRCRQGRPNGVRGTAGTPGHPARFLATPDTGSDRRRARRRGGCRVLRTRRW